MDQNYLLNLENAIIEKYGPETVENPRKYWDVEQEKKYLQEIKDISKNESKQHQEHLNLNGVFMPAKLFMKENSRICCICNKYSFKKCDDVYLSKYNSCLICFIEKIEGREQKWLERNSKK